MSERQTSTPFARSRASKGRSNYAKPLSPEAMRARSLAHNRAVAQEQAEMRGRKVAISELFAMALHGSQYMQEFRLQMYKERGQFKGGVAV